jgi:RNA polymerase sigma factor (sigma-70 family)
MARNPSALLSQVRRLLQTQQARGVEDIYLLQLFMYERDEEAFAELVRRHGPLVLGVCRRVLRNPHDADDVFQATFLVLARKARSIRKQGSLPSWLHGVAYRLSLKCQAAAQRRQAKERLLSDAQQPIRDDQAARELFCVLDEELHRLPEQQRLPLVLCYAEGKSQEEASRDLGWSRGTLKRRLERGRDVLRKRLTRRGFALPAVAVMGLAPQELLASVPAALAATTVRIAGLLVAGDRLNTIPMTATVAALVSGALESMSISKVKAIAALLFTLTFVSTAGVIAHQALRDRSGKSDALSEETRVAATTKQEVPESPGRFDVAGDPLPDGVLRRFGSVRFRGDAFAFSTDGKLMVTSLRPFVFVLDARTGKELRRLPGYFGHTEPFALTPDGSRLATASLNTIHVWNLATGKEIRRLEGDFGRVSQVALSADGNYVACDGCKTQLAIFATLAWEVSSGRRLWRVGGPDEDNSSLHPVAFSPDGRSLITRSEKTGLVLRDVATGKAQRTLSSLATTEPVAIANKEPLVAALDADNCSIDIFQLPEGKRLRRLGSGLEPVWTMAFSPDDKLLAAYAAISRSEPNPPPTKFIRLWDVASGKELQPIPIENGPVLKLSFVPGQTQLAYKSFPENVIRFVDIRTGRGIAASAGHIGQVQALAFSPDGKLLLSGSCPDATIRFWNPATGVEVRHVAAPTFYDSLLAYSPDGKHIACKGSNPHHLCLRDGSTGVVVRQWKAHESVMQHLSFSPDGKFLASQCRPSQPGEIERSIKLWDAATGRELMRFDFQDRYITSTAISFSPDSKVVYAWDCPFTRGWSTETGREIPRITNRFRGIRMLHALAPDGRSMIASDLRRDPPSPPVKAEGAPVPPFALYEVSTGKERLRFKDIPPDSNTLVCFVFSPDGRFVGVGGLGEPQQIYLWDTRTGKRLAVLDGHNGWVTDLAFAPDGKTLASASNDTTVLLWDMTKYLHDRPDQPLRAPADMERSWTDLASADARKAYQAILALADTPRLTVPLLRSRLQPAPTSATASVSKWIADLDSAHFADREKSARALEAVGELAVPELEKALRNPASAEVSRRIETLLQKVQAGVIQPDVLLSLRAVEVLDRIGTKDARAVLASLAQGAPEARLTREARTSLSRLDLLKRR